ncbi:MAG: proteasome activator [Actinomycetota bacterium]
MSNPEEESPEIPKTEIVGEADEAVLETVTAPAKVMRIGSMIKQLLDEVHSMTLDAPSRERLAEIYERSIVELAEALSPDLQEELRMLALPFNDGDVPTDAELRVAKAHLVGWLEGLFHGIQATMFAQQLSMRQNAEQRQIQSGKNPNTQPGDRPGTYL